MYKKGYWKDPRGIEGLSVRLSVHRHNMIYKGKEQADPAGEKQGQRAGAERKEK